MNMNTGINSLSGPARNLVEDARELIEATANVAGEKVAEARRRLGAAIDKGKDAWLVVQDSAVSGAKATDRVIRANPYPSVGIAFGLGLLLGFLVRSRD